MRLARALPAALAASLGFAAAVPVAWADSPVRIEGGDEDTQKAILDLLPDRDAPDSLFDAERIGEEAAARALAWLRSEGYYAAAVTPEADDNPARARLVIAPGPRFRFAAPSLVYDDAPPEPAAQAAAIDALNGVHVNAPARAESVLHAEAGALGAIQAAGYASAAAGVRNVVVDHATQTVAVELHFNAGQASRLGQVRAEPGDILRADFVDNLRNWRVGDPYAPETLARVRRDLSATGAVSRVATRLADPDENGLRDVILDIEAAPRNAYEFGVGYSTTEGLGAEAEWTRRNFSHRADALTLSATLGERQQRLAAGLSRPHAAGLGHTVNLGAALQHEDTEAFSRTGASIFASVDATPRLRVGRSYGASLSADRFDDLAGGVTDAYVLSGFADLRFDTTEFSLDPRDGAIVEFRLEPSVSTGDETLGFVRAIGEGRLYESFGRDDRLTLAARGRAGWLEPVAGNADDVPPDRRFYAGGGGSVRGYAYNSLYPRERDAAGLSPGGQGAIEGSVEARWRFDDHWGAAAFVDAGGAFDEWREAGDLSWGAGFGVRYNLGFAPLRVDVAFPFDKEKANSDYALYISVGQAF